jgi:hypothetical protein
MNIRPKRVANSKEQLGAMTVYRMQRVVNGERLNYNLAFSDAHMTERGMVAHRILRARHELRAAGLERAHG